MEFRAFAFKDVAFKGCYSESQAKKLLLPQLCGPQGEFVGKERGVVQCVAMGDQKPGGAPGSFSAVPEDVRKKPGEIIWSKTFVAAPKSGGGFELSEIK